MATPLFSSLMSTMWRSMPIASSCSATALLCPIASHTRKETYAIMTFNDTLQETYTAISANKARSSLTILGIVIGISSVIALVSIGQGASAGIQSSIQSLGSNLIQVTPGAQRS